MTDLAKALCHSRSRVTHTVKRMQLGGLVFRTSAPHDGRGVVAVMADEVALTVTDNVVARIVFMAFAMLLVVGWLLRTATAMMRCVNEEGA